MLRRGLPVEYSYSIKGSFYFKMCISFLFFFFKKLWWGKEGGQGPPPAWALISYCVSDNTSVVRLQNSPHFCVFKYARAVKQKVWNEAENRERDWGETLKIRFLVLLPHTPYGRVRLTRFARARLFCHALPISLLILRKKTTVLQSNQLSTFFKVLFLFSFLTVAYTSE